MSSHKGMPVCAAVGGPVSAASLTRTLRGWTAPALRWAARRCSGPPSARQRARTDAAPCRTSSPPEGHSGQHRRRGARPVPLIALAPTIPSRGLCRLLTLLSVSVAASPCRLWGRVCRAAPGTHGVHCAHQQDSQRWPPALAVGQTRRASVLEDHGRGHGACRTRCGRGLACSVEATCPHTPRASLRSQGRSSGLSLAGLCAADRDAVEGFPWPGKPRGWAQLGSRSPGLPLAAAVLPAWGRRNVRSARSCVKARLLPLRFSRALRAALTPAPSAWASPRKQEEHNLQRPAAYRPGERSARFSPPPLETQRPWEAQPPLRVAAAHSPQKHSSEQACFFCF